MTSAGAFLKELKCWRGAGYSNIPQALGNNLGGKLGGSRQHAKKFLVKEIEVVCGGIEPPSFAIADVCHVGSLMIAWSYFFLAWAAGKI